MRWEQIEPELPPPPAVPSARERILLRLALAYGLLLLILPVTLDGMADLVRYIAGR